MKQPYTHIYPLPFGHASHSGHHPALTRGPCSIQNVLSHLFYTFPGGTSDKKKNPPANAGDARDPWFDPWVRKIPRRKAWQTTAVFLPGESHGQRSRAGYSPWGCKELDTTEVT